MIFQFSENRRSPDRESQIIHSQAMLCRSLRDPEASRRPGFGKRKDADSLQCQRLSIARSLLRNAPVLLMEEATSALDVETERNVLRNILQKSPERTVILTTHRPTVLSMCDRVYRVVDRQITQLDRQEIETIVRSF